MRLPLRVRSHRENHVSERHSVRGQSIAELALILPILLLMASGIFEFSRLIYATVCVSHAARDGARLAMDMNVANGTVSQRVIESAAPFTITSSDVSISSRSAGGMVTVTVTYHFSSPLPLINNFFSGGQINVTRTRVARVQD